VILTFGYAACALLALNGRTNLIPWVMPILVCFFAWPLHWFLSRKVRSGIEQGGRRPRCRRDLMFLWLSITVIGLLWTAWLITSGLAVEHWYLIPFAWCPLNFVGYVMNGVLVSNEWFWAAGALLASLTIAFAAGANFYWLPAVWIPGTLVLAGLMGYRNARRQIVEA
jgi:hypothetical protein